MNDIIKMYSNTYVKGEVRSKEYEAKIKQEKRLNLKLDLADTIFNDMPFTFTKNQKDHVKELIRTFPNFNDLHSKATNEEIIIAFIFYIKALEDKKTKINNPQSKKFLKKHIDEKKLDSYPTTAEIISWKITQYYIQNSYIKPREPKHIDHNILYKG